MSLFYEVSFHTEITNICLPRHSPLNNFALGLIKSSYVTLHFSNSACSYITVGVLLLINNLMQTQTHDQWDVIWFAIRKQIFNDWIGSVWLRDTIGRNKLSHDVDNSYKYILMSHISARSTFIRDFNSLLQYHNYWSKQTRCKQKTNINVRIVIFVMKRTFLHRKNISR